MNLLETLYSNGINVVQYGGHVITDIVSLNLGPPPPFLLGMDFGTLSKTRGKQIFFCPGVYQKVGGWGGGGGGDLPPPPLPTFLAADVRTLNVQLEIFEVLMKDGEFTVLMTF